jgi:hypothetical protein
MESTSSAVEKSSLEGLWVLLVDEPAVNQTARVPMMARAGNHETYLLGFKNVFNARKFLEHASVKDAEPRMIVKGNKSEFLALAQSGGAIGVLVDYDPTTQAYAGAAELY